MVQGRLGWGRFGLGSRERYPDFGHDIDQVASNDLLSLSIWMFVFLSLSQGSTIRCPMSPGME